MNHLIKHIALLLQLTFLFHYTSYSQVPDTITPNWINMECKRLEKMGIGELSIKGKYLLPDTNTTAGGIMTLGQGKQMFFGKNGFDLDTINVFLDIIGCKAPKSFGRFSGFFKKPVLITDLKIEQNGDRSTPAIWIKGTYKRTLHFLHSSNSTSNFTAVSAIFYDNVTLTLPNGSGVHFPSSVFKGQNQSLTINRDQFAASSRQLNILGLYNLNNTSLNVELFGNVERISLLRDTIPKLQINRLDIEKEFNIIDSDIDTFIFVKSNFNEDGIFVNAHWDYFKGFKIRISKSDLEYHSNKHQFSELLKVYTDLFNQYKLRGDLESANGCYAEKKQVETRRWKYLFEQNKSFESFFRWQLNVFLNYFTDYGTNPAKAVIKSGWVILLFSIFYLFFPSDWDVSNRSQLLSKLNDLASKNREKSFLATFGFVAYSGFIHILNALTLSLNAFTTLGFGDIPTHGAARYVTIVQGFIGWFLLTIFSVSLINQVLG